MTFGNWWRLLRTYSFPATIVPVICATLTTRRLAPGQVEGWTVLLMLSAALLLHAAVNLLNDYYDFTLGYDTEQSSGSSGLLVSGKLRPDQVLLWARIYLLLAVVAGLPLVWRRGWPLLIVGILGCLGAYFYSHSRLGYKYGGWGEAAVFVLMGPLLYCGTSLAVAGICGRNSLLLSLPYGCLVTAIMLVNNLRDVEEDRLAGFRTLPQVAGPLASRLLLTLLLVAPVPLILLSIYAGVMPHLTALTLLSVPALVPLLRDIWRRNSPDRALKTAPQRTAAVYLLFGILIIAGELGTILLR